MKCFQCNNIIMVYHNNTLPAYLALSTANTISFVDVSVELAGAGRPELHERGTRGMGEAECTFVITMRLDQRTGQHELKLGGVLGHRIGIVRRERDRFLGVTECVVPAPVLGLDTAIAADA